MIKEDRKRIARVNYAGLKHIKEYYQYNLVTKEVSRKLDKFIDELIEEQDDIVYRGPEVELEEPITADDLLDKEGYKLMYDEEHIWYEGEDGHITIDKDNMVIYLPLSDYEECGHPHTLYLAIAEKIKEILNGQV